MTTTQPPLSLEELRSLRGTPASLQRCSRDFRSWSGWLFFAFLGTEFFPQHALADKGNRFCFEEDGSSAFRRFPRWWLILISRRWEAILEKNDFPSLPFKRRA